MIQNYFYKFIFKAWPKQVAQLKTTLMDF